MIDINDVLIKLNGYFSGRNDVVMAFLFGSVAKRRSCSESDVDVAVYLKDPPCPVADDTYPSENEIWLDVERILGREVDLLILNRAFPSVAEGAIKGIPIIIKDRRIYMAFLMRVVSEAIDFREFVESWWVFKERRGHAAKTRG